MSEIVDTYILVFTFIVWLPGIWVGVLNSVYVPLIHRLKGASRAEFRQQMMGLTLICAGFLYLLLATCLPYLSGFLPGDLSEEAVERFARMARSMAPIAASGLVAAQLSVQLLAEEKHANTLSDAIPSFVLMLALLFWPLSSAPEQPFIWGTLSGFGLQAVGLYLLVVRHGLSTRPTFAFDSAAWADFRKAISILGLSGIVMSFIEPVCSLIAVGLGEGNVARLGYSNRVLALFLTLGSVAVSRAVLPVLSSTSRTEAQRVRLAVQWFAILFSVGVVFAIVAWFAAPFIVTLLLQRGQFTVSDAAVVIEGVQYGVFQFPFYFSGIVLVQLYASLGYYRSILVSSCIALVVKLSFALVLSRYLSFGGIVLASAPMYLCTNLFFVWNLTGRRRAARKLAQV